MTTSIDKPGKFCPACKFLNAVDATQCINCGAPLEGGQASYRTTKHVDESKAAQPYSISEEILKQIPKAVEGIAIYILGSTTPMAVQTEQEFVIGRIVEPTKEIVVDLSSFGGFEMGVSRRHAIIRQGPNGYEIMDLGSTNGTWLNGQRLAPNKPYALLSASHIRVAGIRLFVICGSTTKK
jgi:pSer/pThr/pTyr-binding forkhead associated (FHA) protein